MGTMACMSCQKERELVNDVPLEPLTRSIDSASGDHTPHISKEEALKIVEPITSKYPDRWVDISNEIILAGTEISYNQLGHVIEVDDISYITSPTFDAWLIVIGFNPTYLGKQELLHIFVSVETGEISEQWVNGKAIVEWDTSRKIYCYDDSIPTISKRVISSPPARGVASSKWAVIISGGSYNEDNYSCLFQDTKLLFNTLVGVLGYSKENIFCLLSDGNDSGLDQHFQPYTYINSNTDFDGDNVSDVLDEATKTNITAIFNLLSQWVEPGDEVLVCLIGHGLPVGGFCLWDSGVLLPSELDSELDKLGLSVMIDVVLEFCYSGAFISTLSATNRTITTSSSATELSGAFYYGINAYCVFLRPWIECIPVYDNENTNDAYVAPAELYNSATESMTVAGYSEHPQFDSTPFLFGYTHTLKGEMIPSISGSDYLSTNINSLYSIQHYPNPTSVIWSVDYNASLVSYTDSTAIVKGDITFPGRFCSSTSRVSANMVVDGKSHHISKLIESVWKPGIYNNGNNIWGSNGSYHVRHLGGEYGYFWQSDNPAWQILGYNEYTVNVSEGNTNNPVNLIVAFSDPLGETIVVKDQVH